jgi:Cof subfamily protein (haloacid dehalogenase superfamily)
MHNLSPYQVLALDLDDTLLRSDRTISPRTLELLRCWRARGGQLVIATGRPPRSIAEALPADFHDAPWIAYNGAQIYEAGTKTYENLIPVEDTQRILTILLEALPTCMLGLEIDNTLFLNQESNRPSPYQLAVDLLAVATAPSAKVLFFHEEFSSLSAVLACMPSTARALLSTKYRLVQILAATADKAEALRHWVAGQGLEMAQVVAFGDDVNDVEMVRHAGLGVAVANAVPEVKAVARRITLSNDEDGVAHVLTELLG